MTSWLSSVRGVSGHGLVPPDLPALAGQQDMQTLVPESGSCNCQLSQSSGAARSDRALETGSTKSPLGVRLADTIDIRSVESNPAPIAQLTQLTNLKQPEVPVLLLAHVKRRLANANLSADIANRLSCLRPRQGEQDLLLRKLRLLHRFLSLPCKALRNTLLQL